MSERQVKFAREVGSIVLGVLIALAIGEAADAVRWRARASASLAEIRTELSGNRYNLAERLIEQPCIERRLGAIRAVLATARRTGRLPRVERVGAIRSRTIESAAFEVAKSEGIPLHIDRSRARDIALAYLLTVQAYGQHVEAEHAAWTTLRTIEQAEGPVDPGLVSSLMLASSAAQAEAELVGRIAQQGDAFLAEHDVPVEYLAVKSDAGLRRNVARSKMCQPLLVDGVPAAG